LSERIAIKTNSNRRPSRAISQKPGIGTLNEKPLHETLKRWYAEPGDRLEVTVGGFVADILRRDLIIEIQTRGFSAIKRKLETLLANHAVRLVYPIPRLKWIVRVAGDEKNPVSRRRSPRRGAYEHVFEELIRLPRLLADPNFSLELLLVEEEELRRYDGVRGWRKGGWVTDERRLIRVMEKRTLNTPADMLAFLPGTLAEPFSVGDVAEAMGERIALARKMVYCLRSVGCLAPVGKLANAILYARQDG
jgi:hypothetical protein